jgi:hypothetical membrane protein
MQRLIVLNNKFGLKLLLLSMNIAVLIIVFNLNSIYIHILVNILFLLIMSMAVLVLQSKNHLNQRIFLLLNLGFLLPGALGTVLQVFI